MILTEADYLERIKVLLPDAGEVAVEVLELVENKRPYSVRASALSLGIEPLPNSLALREILYFFIPINRL